MFELLNGLADVALAYVVFALSLLVTIGWLSELRASKNSGDDAEVQAEDARTYYALAAVQRPDIFLSGLVGGAAKILLLLWAGLRALYFA